MKKIHGQRKHLFGIVFVLIITATLLIGFSVPASADSYDAEFDLALDNV